VSAFRRTLPVRLKPDTTYNPYGLSWQINPTILGEMLSDPDPRKSKRVMEAMLKMKKIDIAGLKRAADQK
jgi:hypothetical protein